MFKSKIQNPKPKINPNAKLQIARQKHKSCHLSFVPCHSFVICALSFVILTSGCVSVSNSPNSRFYLPGSLPKEPAAERLEIAQGVIVAVGPIGIPEYQDRPQIVTRNKNGTFSFAQFDRWAEPLDSSLARILSEDLSVMLPSASFQLFPCNFAIPLDYQVIVDILQLDSELAGDMVFAAQWSIIDARNRKMLFTKKSQFIQAINPHNYFGLSQALSSAVASLSKEIAENLVKLSKPPKLQ